jgi:hypothetical protein
MLAPSRAPQKVWFFGRFFRPARGPHDPICLIANHVINAFLREMACVHECRIRQRMECGWGAASVGDGGRLFARNSRLVGAADRDRSDAPFTMASRLRQWPRPCKLRLSTLRQHACLDRLQIAWRERANHCWSQWLPHSSPASHSERFCANCQPHL